MKHAKDRRGIWIGAAVLLWFAWLVWGSGSLAPEKGAVRIQTIIPPFRAAEIRIVDLNDDGASELLVVGQAGEVRTWSPDVASGILAREPRGTLNLPHPESSLLSFFEKTDGPQQLFVLSPEGLVVYPVTPAGVLAPQGFLMTPETRFTLRVAQPTFAPIIQDINEDGFPDLVFPTRDHFELWLHEPVEDGDAKQLMRKAASITLNAQRFQSTTALALTDRLKESFIIPSLDTQDVNGDGLQDLIVENDQLRAFHLLRKDGSIPKSPDMQVNLSIFRDTTPAATLKPGRTLSISDEAQFVSRDLNGDGIPDYVISHRRKVWIFHGSKEGPQFQKPDMVFKVADDITVLQVLHLDSDPYPDLLIIKLMFPTVTTLIRGLVANWDVEITALGYANLEGRSLELVPHWKGEMVLRMPAVLSILRNPTAFVKRFEDAGRKFRTAIDGDFNGDGAGDVAIVTEDLTGIEVWYGESKEDGLSEEYEFGGTLRELLFEEEDRVWSMERVLASIHSLGEQRAVRLTGGRPADILYSLALHPQLYLAEASAHDFHGDGQDEVVIIYRSENDPKNPEALIDLLFLQRR